MSFESDLPKVAWMQLLLGLVSVCVCVWERVSFQSKSSSTYRMRNSSL